MSVSPQLKAIIDNVPNDFASPRADYLAVRESFAPYHGHPVSDQLSIERVELDETNYAHYRLSGQDNNTVAFHCHGGAFVSTPVDEYHFYAELIARQLRCEVVMPDYRLAPEHQFPAAHDDCFNCYRRLLDNNIKPENIILMGESCGGSLAVGLMLRAREEGLPLPRCFVSLTGWFDLSVSGPIVAGYDPFLTPEWVRNRGRDYIGNNICLNDPRVSPAVADLRGLPPMYLQIGEYDTVREGAFSLAENSARAGIAVTVECLPMMIHGLHGLVNAGVPEAELAWEGIRRYLAII